MLGISDLDIRIIMNTRVNPLFNVFMEIFDRTEITNINRLYILDTFKRCIHPHRSNHYRNNGLAISRHTNGYTMNSYRKDLIKIKSFQEISLSIMVTTNLTSRFLGHNLEPQYRKPNKDTVYNHDSSNYPPTVIRNLVPDISK